MGKTVVLMAFMALLIACQSSYRPRADLKLIAPYSTEAQAREPFEAPYVVRYAKHGKKLTFIAADHENSVDSKTFRTIAHVFEEFAPQMVVLEGFENKGEESPEWYLQHARECESEGYKQCGESSYAATLASQKNIPFVAGEPTDHFILGELRKKGFGTSDLMGFYIVRYIPQWRRQGVLRQGSLERRIERVGSWILKEKFESHETFSWDGFAKWYLEKLKTPFDSGEISTESVSPRVDKTPTFLNRIAHEVGMVREQHLVTVIESSFKKHDRVLVIYGAGHLVKQRAVLKDMLGSPEFEGKSH